MKLILGFEMKSSIAKGIGKILSLPPVLSMLLLVSCSGGGGGGGEATTSYSIGGTASGLAATGSVVLQDNLGDSLTVAANGAFTFVTKIADKGAYSVSVLTQATGQTCSVSTGAGIVSGNNVTNVAVVCADNAYNVGGSVSGLNGSVVLQDNNGDNLTVAANGSFTFVTQVAYSSPYSVTVLTQPTGQNCSVGSGIGTMGTANVANVVITCAINTYTIGGTVSNLSGSMVLQDSGADNLTVAVNGPFTFPTAVAYGQPYSVSVHAQPIGQLCSVSTGAGTVSGNVSNVAIGCINGPVVFNVDSSIVYSGVATTVNVYASAYSLPVSSVAIVPSGKSTPVTSLTFTPATANLVSAVIPSGLPVGSYDVLVTDATTVTGVLSGGLTVISNNSLVLGSVTPPIGNINTDTNITIKSSAAFLASSPRAFLVPLAGGSATALNTVFVDTGTLAALVPAATLAAGVYNLVVINPDGTTGVLSSAYTATAAALPVVNGATPTSIVNATGQAVVFSGQNFSASTISLSCVDTNGNPVAAPSVTSGATACGSGCTQTATINASTLSAGSVCVARLTNSDGTYFDYSAIGVTNLALNLNSTHAGSNMIVGRRAPVAATVGVSNSASNLRYVYAIGGDGGASFANAPFSSAEFASVDQYGNMGKWNMLSSTLSSARSFAGSAVVGRYIYVFGGSDGTNTLRETLNKYPHKAEIVLTSLIV